MSTSYRGINYWPLDVNFYESNAIELSEAQYGIKADTAICKLLCKIFKEGYYIYWGEEQLAIFTRKLGGEVNTRDMHGIINILLEKDFFDKESYEKYHILTSAEIQRIWLEATYRRKRDLSELPYLLNVPSKKAKNDGNIPESADIFDKSANISQQSKAEHSKKEEEEDTASPLIQIPEYARNTQTHNVTGLLESLRQHRVTNAKEINAILQLSDYGKKETQVWVTLSSTNWSKIESPGKYIISTLKR